MFKTIVEQGLVQSVECIKHMNIGSGSSELSTWARGPIKCAKKTNSGTGSSELSVWAKGLVECTKKTNSGTGSSELGGRERKKKKKKDRSSELECKKIAPAIFNINAGLSETTTPAVRG